MLVKKEKEQHEQMSCGRSMFNVLEEKGRGWGLEQRERRGEW